MGWSARHDKPVPKLIAPVAIECTSEACANGTTALTAELCLSGSSGAGSGAPAPAQPLAAMLT